jgi:hypothetical protein
MGDDTVHAIRLEDDNEDKSRQDTRSDVGFLFVHGIGLQKRGETLTEFGDGLIKWLQRWREGIGPSQDFIKPVSATSDGLTVDPTTPAHAKFDVKKDSTSSTWLMAESWWADAFVSISFRDLAFWGFLVLPWTILTHYAIRLRRARVSFDFLVIFFLNLFARRLSESGKEKAAKNSLFKAFFGVIPALFSKISWEIIIWFRFLVVPLFLVAIAELVVLLLIILAALPIPWLRSLVISLQAVIAGYLGDCYVLLASPMRSEAILTRVRRDFEWLAERCKKVVIIAHSQGAAVAYLALNRGVPPNFKNEQILLFTFGSGLGKLESLRPMLGDKLRLVRIGYTPLLFAILSVSGLASGLWNITQLNIAQWNWPTILGVVFFVVLFIDYFRKVVILFRDYQKNKLDPDRYNLRNVKGFEDKLVWIDCFASCDPVSNGSLFDRKESEAFFGSDGSVAIHNYGSVISDHTAYWRNQDEFVSIVVHAFDDILGTGLLSQIDGKNLDIARYRRKLRTKLLVGTRYACMVLALVVIFVRSRELSSLGDRILAKISPADEWLIELMHVSLSKVHSTIGSGAVAVVCISVFTWVIYLILRFFWYVCESIETDRFFRRKEYRIDQIEMYFAATLLYLVIALIMLLELIPGHRYMDLVVPCIILLFVPFLYNHVMSNFLDDYKLEPNNLLISNEPVQGLIQDFTGAIFVLFVIFYLAVVPYWFITGEFFTLQMLWVVLGSIGVSIVYAFLRISFANSQEKRR